MDNILGVWVLPLKMGFLEHLVHVRVHNLGDVVNIVDINLGCRVVLVVRLVGKDIAQIMKN